MLVLRSLAGATSPDSFTQSFIIRTRSLRRGASKRSMQLDCKVSCRSAESLTANGTDHDGQSGPQFSSDDAGGVPGFGNTALRDFSMAIVGDLHLEPSQMPLFHSARQQLRSALRGAPLAGTACEDSGVMPANSRVVQLGDLGGYSNSPGSRACFETAAAYLGGFGSLFALVTGNHDLEGAEFQTDQENLAAWHEVFRQRHYWAEQLGPVLCIGLSTVRFRSNEFSVHEVHVDAEQMRWFEATLESNPEVPIVVFTHAPPMGSGLKVVQEVHVKNRCAWLNHSSEPAAFIRLAARHPNIRLWFSGHFHLSHNYVDSISVVGGCAFVQTGVIGACNRDGNRQSRLLRADGDGYRLYTLDHESGEERLDLQHRWGDRSAPQPVRHPEEMLCDTEGGWLCSELECGVAPAESCLAPAPAATAWFTVGPQTIVALQSGRLVEYDIATMSPTGIVCLDVGEHCSVKLVDKMSRELHYDGRDSDGGSRVAALELHDSQTGGVRRFERNSLGSFFTIFQQNKWRKRLEEERKLAAAS